MTGQTIATTARPKIFILGGSGTGKTRMSMLVGELFHTPVHHMDSIAFDSRMRPRPIEERERLVAEIVTQSSWIAEGVYVAWATDLLEDAAFIIWLDDISWSTAVRRVIWRFFRDALVEARNRRGPERFARVSDYYRQIRSLARAVREIRAYHGAGSSTPDRYLSAPLATDYLATSRVLVKHRNKVIHCRQPNDIRVVIATLRAQAAASVSPTAADFPVSLAMQPRSLRREAGSRRSSTDSGIGRRASGVSSGPWPNLFVVGAPKAGTTSLWYYLSQHPDVFMSSMKEPHFFAQITPSRRFAMFFPHISDEETYMGLFAGAADYGVIGEASPSYLSTKRAAAAIRAVSPDARIIVLLREPVARAYSHYWNDAAEGLDHRSFSDAIREELAGPTGAWGVSSLYLRCGLYSDDLERYIRLFGSNVLTLFFEDLIRDVPGTMEKVFTFLGVAPTQASHLDVEPKNAFKTPRNALTRQMLGAFGLRRTARAVVPTALHPAIRGLLITGGDKPVMDQKSGRLLEEYYAEDARRLKALLSVELPWPAGDAVIGMTRQETRDPSGAHQGRP